VSVNAELQWSARSGDVALFAFLLFLYFPIRDLLDSSAGATHVVLVLAGLALFVALYLSLMLVSTTPFGRLDEWLRLAVMAALALAIAFDNTAEWASLFIYVAAVGGFRLPPRQGPAAILTCAGLAAAAGAAGDYPSSELIAYTLYVLAIGFLLLSFARLLHANAELRAAREEIARLAVADERLRFARDLHDLLGHSLSVIALKSELAGRLLADEPPRAAAEVAEIEQVARDALEQVRETVTGYRRMTLKDELAGARMALSAAGIEATIEGVEATLGPETEAILAWAVREGTTNVIRHSGAQRCEIRVRAGLADAAVEVVDDGLGGDRRDGGSGLAGLAERASRRRGRVDAGPRPEGGFRLRVSVPTT
jgi:two-component system, NarL family, sensor histidine kinase DesK